MQLVICIQVLVRLHISSVNSPFHAVHNSLRLWAAGFLVIVISYNTCLKALVKRDLPCGMWNVAVFLCKLPSCSSRTFSCVAKIAVSYGHSYDIISIVACDSLLRSSSKMIRVCFGGRRNMHGRKFWYGHCHGSENELELCAVISRVGSNEPNFLRPNLGDERKLAQTGLESGCYNWFSNDEI